MRAIILLDHEVSDLTGSKKFAKGVSSKLMAGDTILLYGNLGSGKTFLVKEMVRNLGVKTEVSSPSFAIINQYQGEILIHHIDLYRIENTRELVNLGLEEILNSESINFIEWPQKIEDEVLWPHFRICIETDPKKDTWRHLTLTKHQ